MNRWSKFWNFKPLSQTLALFHGRAFLCNIHILVLFLLLRTTEIRKKKINKRIVTPACTLTIVVYVIHFLREQMILTGKQRNPAMKDDGQNFSTCFIRRLYSATVSTDSIYGKKFVKVQSWPPSAFTHFISNSSFTNVMWRWVFLRAFYVQQCKRYPLLFLSPTDNNSLSLCSFMENIPLPPSPPPVGGKLIYIPIALTKAETARDTFFARFFFHYYLLNNNWQLNSYIICENFLQFNQERCTIFS